MLIYAVFNGMFFALGSLAKFGTLLHAPAAIVFPLNRLNTVLVMASGFLLFHEIPKPPLEDAMIRRCAGTRDGRGKQLTRRARSVAFALADFEKTNVEKT